MTKDEALKLALKFVEDTECGTADLEAAIKEALAQRTWVGLTDEERHELVRVFLGYYKDFKTTDAFIMRIERLIKEKNG